jgi:hypothetical protein
MPESDAAAPTPEDFRRLALDLPEAAEHAHFGTPDFRVRGRIFATLSAAQGTAVLKLQRPQQEMLCAAEPALFEPVPGRWGQAGWTTLRLALADETTLRSVLRMAWNNVAPKRRAADG